MKFNWQNLKKPFFALAPMEGATDTVFRQIVIDCGKPDVIFTEFTNVEGLLSKKGNKEVGRRLFFEKKEKPIIAQIWGINPEAFFEASQKIVEMGFDGIDINMGCPERKVVSHGACSALIQNPKLAAEIIEAVKKGIVIASEAKQSNPIPISVKTRIGFKEIETERWISFLLKQNLDALTVHFRTQKEMSLVPSHFEEAAIVSELRNKLAPKTVIIGNGDILSVKHGEEFCKKYNIDGAMIGRGVFKNPYVFNPEVNYNNQTVEQRFALLKKHLDLFEKTWTKTHPLSEKDYKKSYPPLKRFFKIYISGFEGAAEIRERLMSTQNIEEVKETLQKYI